MANREQKKVKIDGNKLMSLIKSCGYSLKTLSDKTTRSDRSIRYAINYQSMPEDLFQEIEHALDIDLTEVLINPESVNRERRTRKNIISLAEMFCGNLDTAAERIGLTEEEISSINSDKIPISRELMDKLSNYFGLSPEMIMNNDLSDIEFSFDPSVISRNIDVLFPLRSSEVALKNNVFAKAYKSHQIIFDAEKELHRLSEDELDKAINDCLECYDDLESRIYPEEAWVNAISFYFYLVINAKIIEMIAGCIHHQERYPALMEKLMEVNPDIKIMIDELEKSGEIEDGTPFHDILSDPDFKKGMRRILMHLKRNPLWSDLTDYYICLMYAFGIVENNFSEQQNSEFGFELLHMYRSIGNKYAKKCISLIRMM